MHFSAYMYAYFDSMIAMARIVQHKFQVKRLIRYHVTTI